MKLLLVMAAVILLRLPFLHQAVQGDDVYYLAEAEHAQIEPLHPQHFHYVFLGDAVDMRGHSHPPMNAWILGALLAVFGDVREAWFHAAYIVFSLMAAVAMWSLARRFSSHPLWAALLFVATPAFVINGNSFESDLPFLAFWMAAAALYVAGRYFAAAAALILAGLTSYQAVFLTPILALYVWLFDRKRRAAWAIALVPALTPVAWQVFERLTTGALPASVLMGYFQHYGFQELTRKLRSAAGLSIHALWLVFPLLLAPAVARAWRNRRDPNVVFLAGWIAIFFAGAIAVFFAGSARYLLPMAAPVALMASELRPAALAAGVALQIALGLALATVNFQHWDAYRRFATSLPKNSRTWVNGDWGLRFYLESAGGLPLQRGQGVRPDDLIVSSELSAIAFTAGGVALAPIAQAEIRPAIPLRLIGLDSRSGYSTSDKGLFPFGISTGPIDRLRADQVVERRPTREYLPMDAPEAEQQIVRGIYPREGNNRWRWTSEHAVVMLKRPAGPERLRVVFTIHDAAPARTITVLLDGKQVATHTYGAPGTYTLVSDPVMGQTVDIVVDKTFSVPSDLRQLGIILTEVGFQP